MDNLTPLTPPEARRITPEDQPVYPCWLYHNPNGWWRANAWPFVCDVGEENTHWHPDQPTPPTQPPAPLAGGTEPATSEREAELREAIVAGVVHYNEQKKPMTALPDCILAALTLLLDRREGEHEKREEDLMRAWSADLTEHERNAAALRTLAAKWKDCAEYGWTIIANASGGNWKKESADWQTAATKFRDENYYPCLRLTPSAIADELAALKAEIARRDEETIELKELLADTESASAKWLGELQDAGVGSFTADFFLGKPTTVGALRAQLTTAHAHMDKLREHRNVLDTACHELEGKLREFEAARKLASDSEHD